MEFCPNCGMRLILTEKSNEEETISIMVCSKCNYTKHIGLEESTKNKTKQKVQETITVIDEELSKIRTMPTTKILCPKCSNNEAYWWMVQTRGADESPTQFFRCTNCNHTWREMT
jgi:DNA-directed RNA polymerase subunit M